MVCLKELHIIAADVDDYIQLIFFSFSLSQMKKHLPGNLTFDEEPYCLMMYLTSVM